MVIDGEEQAKTLFKLVKDTLPKVMMICMAAVVAVLLLTLLVLVVVDVAVVIAASVAAIVVVVGVVAAEFSVISFEFVLVRMLAFFLWGATVRAQGWSRQP